MGGEDCDARGEEYIRTAKRTRICQQPTTDPRPAALLQRVLAKLKRKVALNADLPLCEPAAAALVAS